jgi:hypothetical protein
MTVRNTKEKSVRKTLKADTAAYPSTDGLYKTSIHLFYKRCVSTAIRGNTGMAEGAPIKKSRPRPSREERPLRASKFLH